MCLHFSKAFEDLSLDGTLGSEMLKRELGYSVISWLRSSLYKLYVESSAQ